jgi:hypothetical protein
MPIAEITVITVNCPEAMQLMFPRSAAAKTETWRQKTSFFP